MHEEIQHWCLSGRNGFQGREFKGVGYVKLVRFAELDEDGTIPLDKDGQPIFRPDNKLGTIHQETGYLMAFRRPASQDGTLPASDWEYVKILNIVRG